MWRTGTVVALHDETATARTITLAVPDWPGHVAGQHVDVRLTAPDGYAAVRSYSIASSPNFERHIDITVDRLPNGEVSPYLTEEVIVGDRLELRGPIGGWFVWRSNQTEPIQLIAGGSGIVPLMAMIRSRVASGNSALFRLLYSVRELGDAALIANATWPANLAPTCYVCGPTSFVESASNLLIASGNHRDRIRTERFGPTGGRK